MPINRRLWTQMAALGSLAPVLGWAQTSKRELPMPAVGTPMALAPVDLLGGGRFEPADAEGKVLVVYWWASWCPFCALQSPEMQKLWDAHRAQGLQMLALSIDKKPEDAIAYLRRKQYTFPAAWIDSNLAQAYPKPGGLPVTLVRGKDGRVVQTEKGQLFAEDVADLKRWL